MKLIPIIIIILLMGVGSWAYAQVEPLQQEQVEKLNLLPKARTYLQQVWREIKVRAQQQIGKPLKAGNSRLDKYLKRIRVDFYRELEEMKISLINLLKLGWEQAK